MTAQPASVYFCSLKSSDDIRNEEVVPLLFGIDFCWLATIRCGAKNEELRGSTRGAWRGMAGVNAFVVEAENALKADAVDSMAITAERCLFKIIMLLLVTEVV